MEKVSILEKPERRALLVTNFGWVGMSTAVQNTASYLIEHGWRVTLLAVGADFIRFPLPARLSSNIEIISNPSVGRNIWRLGFVLYRLFRISLKYDITFIFDYRSLVYSSIPLLFCGNTNVYYSLEFYEPKGFIGGLKKAIERFLAHQCAGIITQHELRAEYLLRHGVGKRAWVVPNSPRGGYLGVAASKHEDEVFRLARLIRMLCIGTLGKGERVDELLSWFSGENSCCELTLHGWFVSDEVELLANEILVRGRKPISISTTFVDDAEKWEIYKRCDIVFVAFSNTCANYVLAAGSAGKLYDAMRAGKPVLAIDSPGMRQIVEGFGIGVVVDDATHIHDGLEILIKKYGFFKKNCEAAHHYYSHDRFFSLMIDQVLTYH